MCYSEALLLHFYIVSDIAFYNSIFKYTYEYIYIYKALNFEHIREDVIEIREINTMFKIYLSKKDIGIYTNGFMVL